MCSTGRVWCGWALQGAAGAAALRPCGNSCSLALCAHGRSRPCFFVPWYPPVGPAGREPRPLVSAAQKRKGGSSRCAVHDGDRAPRGTEQSHIAVPARACSWLTPFHQSCPQTTSLLSPCSTSGHRDEWLAQGHKNEGTFAWVGESSPVVAPWTFMSPRAVLGCHSAAGAEQWGRVLEGLGGGAQLTPRCFCSHQGCQGLYVTSLPRGPPPVAPQLITPSQASYSAPAHLDQMCQ